MEKKPKYFIFQSFPYRITASMKLCDIETVCAIFLNVYFCFFQLISQQSFLPMRKWCGMVVRYMYYMCCVRWSYLSEYLCLTTIYYYSVYCVLDCCGLCYSYYYSVYCVLDCWGLCYSYYYSVYCVLDCWGLCYSYYYCLLCVRLLGIVLQL